MITISKNKRFFIFLTGVAVILSIPLLAMLFTDDVNWNLMDFALAGSLLVGTALGIEFVLQRIKHTNHRIVLAMALLLMLILVWIEFAVGIFNSPIAGS
ncbi:MAG: hypothetical protein AB8B56_00405 [Crocinitomicaceae bacterium]